MPAFGYLQLDASYNPIPIASDLCFATTGVTQCVYLLPPISVPGDTFRIVAVDNLWTILQNSGQTMMVGTVSTTTGVSGSITANKMTDMVEVICTKANTDFRCNVISGNPTIV